MLVKNYRIVINRRLNRIKLDKIAINIYNSRRCRYGNEKSSGAKSYLKKGKELIGQCICTVSDKGKAPA